MVTRRPITPQQVQIGAKALWEKDRCQEGRMEWKEVPPYVREPFENRARIVLETAIPQDATDLREFAEECLRVADIL